MCLGGNAIFSAPEDRGLKNKIRIKIQKISELVAIKVPVPD